MKRTPLSLLAHWCGGGLYGEDLSIGAIDNDTRVLRAGSLYVALRGECCDGHDFATDAVARGASALLVERHLPSLAVPQVLVANTELALARIAAGMQQGRATRVIALTGSNGKTSVKAMLLAILEEASRAEGLRVYASPGNRNNQIGLPLAVIEAPEDADLAIYEMGAGKPGDIAYLTGIVRPDVALVNNIAPAHLERMGTLLAVAQTKGAIYDALPAGGVAVINADDAFGIWFEQHLHRQRADCHVLRFGLHASAQIGVHQLRMQPQGAQFVLTTAHAQAAVRLALPGCHNVRNALAAAGLALGAGIALPVIAAGLARARPVAGRQVMHPLPGGVVLIDDSYNANPGSLDAAIEALAAVPGEGWLVLGDMRELGPQSKALHAAVGRRARLAGLARLYALGELSAAAAAAFGDGARVFVSHDALVAALRADLAAVGLAAAGAAAKSQSESAALQDQAQTQEQELHQMPHIEEATEEGTRVTDGVWRSLAPGARSAVATILVKGSRASAMDAIVRALLAREDMHAA